MKLTRPQVQALLLLRDGPRETTRTSHHGMVSGATAAALIRRGFASQIRVREHFQVAITTAGLAALAAHLGVSA